MAERWGFTHTTFVSDPGGERYLQPLELFDPDERGGIALPGMVIVDPDGHEVYRYQGRDFADRTNDDDIWATLDTLALAPGRPATVVLGVEVPDDLRGYFRPTDFAPTSAATCSVPWRSVVVSTTTRVGRSPRNTARCRSRTSTPGRAGSPTRGDPDDIRGQTPDGASRGSRRPGASGRSAASSSSVLSGPTPSKNWPTSHFQRRRYGRSTAACHDRRVPAGGPSRRGDRLGASTRPPHER